MFSKDYKNEIENIKPDGYIKYKVKRSIEQGVKPKKSHKKAYIITATAAVLCIAIIASVIGIIGSRPVGIPYTGNSSQVITAQSYDNVYYALQKFVPSKWDKFLDFFIPGDDLMLEGTTGNNNITATRPSTDSGSKYESPGGSYLGGSPNHSETTTQVQGVDEADIVKTDGQFIYILHHQDDMEYNYYTVKIVDVRESNPKQLNSINIDNIYDPEMYLSKDRLVVTGHDSDNAERKSSSNIYDITNPAEPKLIQICSQSGNYHSSRLIGNTLFLISNHYLSVSKLNKTDKTTFVPTVTAKGCDDVVSAENIHIYNNCTSPQYTVVSSFDITDGNLLSNQSVLGGSYTVYVNTENIITASNSNNNQTQVIRFSIKDNNIKMVSSGTLEGTLLNQFSIDEYNGYFRFVLTGRKTVTESITSNASASKNTTSSSTTVNSLVVLDGELNEVGKLTDLAPGERVYSARFMGNIVYFVTFRQVDPLFSVDISNPSNPKVIGELKIPGFSNYLFPYGEGKLLGIGQDANEQTGRTTGIKLSMFDISDPANVTESDKTILNETYSEALDNHKAVMVDYDKNLIAFSTYGNNGLNIYVYSYENGIFVQRLLTELLTSYDYNYTTRTLYIGDVFYIVTETEIIYFDINTFEQLADAFKLA